MKKINKPNYTNINFSSSKDTMTTHRVGENSHHTYVSWNLPSAVFENMSTNSLTLLFPKNGAQLPRPLNVKWDDSNDSLLTNRTCHVTSAAKSQKWQLPLGSLSLSHHSLSAEVSHHVLRTGHLGIPDKSPCEKEPWPPTKSQDLTCQACEWGTMGRLLQLHCTCRGLITPKPELAKPLAKFRSQRLLLS